MKIPVRRGGIEKSGEEGKEEEKTPSRLTTRTSLSITPFGLRLELHQNVPPPGDHPCPTASFSSTATRPAKERHDAAATPLVNLKERYLCHVLASPVRSQLHHETFYEVYYGVSRQCDSPIPVLLIVQFLVFLTVPVEARRKIGV